MIQLRELTEIIPIIIIAFSATFILLIEAFSKNAKDVVFGFSVVSVVCAIVASFFQLSHELVA